MKRGDRRICGWSVASIADNIEYVRDQLDNMEEAKNKGNKEKVEGAKRMIKEDYIPRLRTLIKELPRTCAFTPPEDYSVERFTDIIDWVEAHSHYEQVESARVYLRQVMALLPDMLRRR